MSKISIPRIVPLVACQRRSYGNDADIGLNARTTEFIALGQRYFGDLMTYCEPRWISEYTYEGIYSFLKKINSASQAMLAADPNAPFTLPSPSSACDWTQIPAGQPSTQSSRCDCQTRSHCRRAAPTLFALRMLQVRSSLTYPFAPDQDSEGGTATTFLLVLPHHANASKALLLKDGNVLAEPQPVGQPAHGHRHRTQWRWNDLLAR